MKGELVTLLASYTGGLSSKITVTIQATVSMCKKWPLLPWGYASSFNGSSINQVAADMEENPLLPILANGWQRRTKANAQKETLGDVLLVPKQLPMTATRWKCSHEEAGKRKGQGGDRTVS